MHRSKTADAILTQMVIERSIDVLIISEQYQKQITGTWIEDNTRTSAIWVPQHSRYQPSRSGSGECFVWTQNDKYTLMSCYLTPSDSIANFQRKLDAIEDKIRDIGGPMVIAGDFNSKAIEWGMATTNSRGRRILDMAARLGLVVANVGSTPTFSRVGCEGTIPDITMVSEALAKSLEIGGS